MQPVSALFLASLREPHVVAIRATLLQPGKPEVVVPIVGGNVSIDAAAQVRRSGSLQLPWTTKDAAAALGIDLTVLPFGSSVRLERGIRYPDGTTEYAKLGSLRIDSVAWRTTDATATLNFSDRMAQIAGETLLTPYVPVAKTAATAIVELVTQVFGATITYTVGSFPGIPTLSDVTYDGDRSAAVHDLAESIGGRAYFDVDGNFVLTPVPDVVAAAPVWTIDAGTTGVLLDADESLDRTDTFNGVLVRGQLTADAPPISSLKTDDDPLSPTRYGGPFGRIVLVEESTAIQTQAQADAKATALLDRHLGLARQTTIDAVPNPALEADDVVQVVFPDGRVEKHLAVSVRVPLDVSAAVQVTSHSVYRPGSEPAARRAAPQRVDYGLQALEEAIA